jgi:AcrR family transcriptional regulator
VPADADAQPAPATATPRDRFRTQMRAEIKAAALRQIAAGGPAGISVNAIGRELGVSGPALYRYFSSRDALLTELVADAYRDLAAALRDAPGAGPRAAPTARLRALARAYRGWAIAQPHRYGLLFGPPLPGHDAHSEPIVAAAEEAMAALVDVVAAAGVRTGAAPAPRSRLARQLQAWGHDRGTTTEPAVAMRAIAVWSRLHGHVALEIGGNFASMGLDPEALFEAEIDALVA